MTTDTQRRRREAAYRKGFEDGRAERLAGARVVVKPRLTNAMIQSACKGHYGSDNADGICLTVKDRDWSFRDAFKRMWHGAWSALAEPAGEAEPVAQLVSDAMVGAFQSKYREFWKGSWPDRGTTIELIEAALSARVEQ